MLTPSNAKNLSDDVVTKQLHSLATNLRSTEAELVVYLNEIDHRRLYAKAGYSSLFSFCMQELQFSEGTACRRIATARVVAAYPAVLPYLADGRLHITGITMLEKSLTPENHLHLLDKAAGRTKRELEWFLAELAPQADVADSIRQQPNKSPGEKSSEEVPRFPATAAAVTKAAAAAENVVKPLAAERIVIKFSAQRGLEEKIQRARDLLAHKLPHGELEHVFDKALEALLDDIDPARKLARKEARAEKVKKQQKEKEKEKVSKDKKDRSRYVAADVKMAAWKEAGGRCCYVSPDGKRCGETRMLEVDHCQPYALGGGGELGNVRMLCRGHNQYAAFASFGPLEPWRVDKGVPLRP